MKKAIMVINAGSSSIKFSLFIAEDGTEQRLSSRGQVEGINVAPRFEAKDEAGTLLAEKTWDDAKTSHEDLLKYLIDWIESHLEGAKLVAAGHRVVHGGLSYSAPVIIDDRALDALEKLVPLAPLHQPHNLSPIRALRKVHPDLPQIACFDTAFHRSNPDVAQAFALPRAISEEGVRRYGFHGLSYEYIANAMTQTDAKLAKGAMVVAHLGSGASMCAIKDGKSMASTMGFTALDGLPMGTRTGTLDAGVVLYLMQQKGMSLKDVETLLYKESGLLGVSGISNDMRKLSESTDPKAREAIDLFVYRIVRETGSLAAAMGGIDGLVFTAGIGEKSPLVRKEVCDPLKWLGIEIDEQANDANATLISTSTSTTPVYVMATNEELMIARHTLETL